MSSLLSLYKHELVNGACTVTKWTNLFATLPAGGSALVGIFDFCADREELLEVTDASIIVFESCGMFMRMVAVRGQGANLNLRVIASHHHEAAKWSRAGV
jgi:hypothetical protein